MSIPLDRLYHFIDQTAREIYGEPVVIYRFWPYGSKNIQDLCLLKPHDWAQQQQKPGIWCHDHEPLATEGYDTKSAAKSTWQDLLCLLDRSPATTILRRFHNIFKKNILLHSEKRSHVIDQYVKNDELIPVYYWSHAVIAMDWFRYAQHHDFNKNISKTFLIYNRAWSGSREYRLRFTDLLIEHQLIDHCMTFCNPTENGKHYTQHNYKNKDWRPTHVLENYLQPSQSDSCASADFDAKDYEATEIEVVLETLFDDDRLHCTEKSLRPIACRQPFILVATHGSLQYLRDYGFQTFDSIWDETYDIIEDPYQRMQAIISTMREITAWSDVQKLDNIQRMKQIADHNFKHFFSKDFFDLIINELRTNMTEAIDQIKQDPGFDKWLDKWHDLLQFPQIQNFLDVNQNINTPTRQQYKQVLQFIMQHPKTVADRIEI